MRGTISCMTYPDCDAFVMMPSARLCEQHQRYMPETLLSNSKPELPVSSQQLTAVDDPADSDDQRQQPDSLSTPHCFSSPLHVFASQPANFKLDPHTDLTSIRKRKRQDQTGGNSDDENEPMKKQAKTKQAIESDIDEDKPPGQTRAQVPVPETTGQVNS